MHLLISGLGGELSLDHIPAAALVAVGVQGLGEGLGPDRRLHDAEGGGRGVSSDQGPGLDSAELQRRGVNRARDKAARHLILLLPELPIYSAGPDGGW